MQNQLYPCFFNLCNYLLIWTPISTEVLMGKVDILRKKFQIFFFLVSNRVKNKNLARKI